MCVRWEEEGGEGERREERGRDKGGGERRERGGKGEGKQEGERGERERGGEGKGMEGKRRSSIMKCVLDRHTHSRRISSKDRLTVCEEYDCQ